MLSFFSAAIFFYLVPLLVALYYCFRYSLLQKEHLFKEYILTFIPMINILIMGLFYANYTSLRKFNNK